MNEEKIKRLLPLKWAKNLYNFKNKKILIIGLGALGSNIVDLLIRAGVKNLILIDRDFVEYTDLLTSPLYDLSDAETNKPKVIAVKEKIEKLDKEVNLDIYFENFSSEFSKNFNFEKIDLIIDAVDNLETRFLINEISYKQRIPWIHGACVAERGEIAFFKPWEGTCYRCLFPDIPVKGRLETCETSGINPVIAKTVAGIQVDIAMKYLLSGREYTNKMIYIDFSEDYSLRTLEIKKRKDCPVCVKGNFEFMKRKGEKIVTFCSEKSVMLYLDEFDIKEIEKKWEKLENFTSNKYFMGFKDKNIELKLYRDGKLFIKSEEHLDLKKVKTIISKFIGE